MAVFANILLGYLTYIFLERFITDITKIKVINKWYLKYHFKVQEKIKRYVEKYGEFGVAAFIAIPIPGSGVVSGAFAAHLIGMKIGKFLIAMFIGVLIAATLVTALTGIFI